jgi:two-component system, OmpR family, response regulator MprA
MTENGSRVPGVSKVLVLDDDNALLRLLRLTLTSEGFEVITASNGLEGLEKVDQEPPDVILLDLEMPVMDGRTFFRELRKQGNNTPVLILSAYGARDAQRELHANGSLEKPFEADVLMNELKQLALV